MAYPAMPRLLELPVRAVVITSPGGPEVLNLTEVPDPVPGGGEVVVEVFCRCDRALAARRDARRGGTRPAGHFDARRTPGEIWNDDVARPVAGGWPVLEVDTTGPVGIGSLAARIRAAAR